ncbi:hypothetical protein K4039_25380, partial [Lyngbya sp. CCAP 1446/10]|nr:hypothetical protein [Lyngbya sp. CCAP 1446/10]
NDHVPFWRAVEEATPSLTLIIRNEGLRILALGSSATALGGNVRPKKYGRKSTTSQAVADELGSLHHTA